MCRLALMTTKRFGSGKSAMSWLFGRGDPDEPKKPARQLSAEINESLAQAKVPKARTSRAKPVAISRGSMTAKQFLLSLPEPLSRRGQNYSSTAQVAKRIREEIALAVNAGVLPDGTKVSIRTDHNSMWIGVSAWRGAVFTDKFVEHLMDPNGSPWDREKQEYHRGGGDGSEGYDERRRWDARLSGDLNKALAFIEKLAHRHNYDNSDSQSDHFDVGYYLHVDARPVEDVAKNSIELESDKDYRALMEKARVAAKAVGPACTKAICGDAGLTKADKSCIERLIKIADRANGRPVAFDKRRRGWYPVG